MSLLYTNVTLHLIGSFIFILIFWYCHESAMSFLQGWFLWSYIGFKDFAQWCNWLWILTAVRPGNFLFTYPEPSPLHLAITQKCTATGPAGFKLIFRSINRFMPYFIGPYVSTGAKILAQIHSQVPFVFICCHLDLFLLVFFSYCFPFIFFFQFLTVWLIFILFYFSLYLLQMVSCSWLRFHLLINFRYHELTMNNVFFIVFISMLMLI